MQNLKQVNRKQINRYLKCSRDGCAYRPTFISGEASLNVTARSKYSSIVQARPLLKGTLARSACLDFIFLHENKGLDLLKATGG